MSVISTISPVRIYLIHHGETDWARANRLTGQTEITLTADGESEAQEVAERLGDIPFSQAMASPRLRARQACRLAKLGKLAEIEPDLSEWDYGDYEGKRPMDIQRQQPGWNLYQHGCPQGESPEQVTGRADRQIYRLRTLRGNVAVFSHGQFGSALAVRWIGLPIAAAAHFPLAMASISILTFSPHYPDVPVIALWNAVSPRRTTPPMALADAALQL